MAVVSGARRARVFAWPRIAAWAWLPTLLLIVVTVLTVTGLAHLLGPKWSGVMWDTR